jgi:hypothetical protein
LPRSPDFFKDVIVEEFGKRIVYLLKHNAASLPAAPLCSQFSMRNTA